MSRLHTLLNEKDKQLSIPKLTKAVSLDMTDGLASLPKWERYMHIFWLLGPFLLLVERTPADVWVSLIAIVFLWHSYRSFGWEWTKTFWVRAGFAFWVWCIFVSALSDNQAYSIGEALVWFRFPLFAIATVFWLSMDKRLLYAMFGSVTVALLLMCCILTAELIIIGQTGDRLTWPFGDKVSGNYLAKVSLPAFVIVVAAAVSKQNRLGFWPGLLAVVSMGISMMTGERINFLTRACCGMLAGIFWKPDWKRYSSLVLAEILAVVLVFTLAPRTQTRYGPHFIEGIFSFEKSGWLHTLYGGWVIAKENLLFGIGVGNFGSVSMERLAGVSYTRVQPHPHNYYIQMLCETGIVGLILGTVFLLSIILTCYKSSLRNKDNIFVATAWVVPFGLFWPLATTADFFGQWNNTFLWSAVAISLCCTQIAKDTSKEKTSA